MSKPKEFTVEWTEIEYSRSTPFGPLDNKVWKVISKSSLNALGHGEDVIVFNPEQDERERKSQMLSCLYAVLRNKYNLTRHTITYMIEMNIFSIDDRSFVKNVGVDLRILLTYSGVYPSSLQHKLARFFINIIKVKYV